MFFKNRTLNQAFIKHQDSVLKDFFIYVAKSFLLMLS